MAHGKSDRDRCTLADPEQVEFLDAGGVHHALEVVDEGFERDFRRIPVGHAVGALVIADQRVAGRELLEPVPPDGALPVMLEMVEPIRGLHERRPLAHHGIGQTGPVLRVRIAHLLLR